MDGIGISGDISLDMNVQSVVDVYKYDELIEQLSASIEELRGELAKKQDATGVYLQIGKDSDGNATPQVVVERGA